MIRTTTITPTTVDRENGIFAECFDYLYQYIYGVGKTRKSTMRLAEIKTNREFCFRYRLTQYEIRQGVQNYLAFTAFMYPNGPDWSIFCRTGASGITQTPALETLPIRAIE